MNALRTTFILGVAMLFLISASPAFAQYTNGQCSALIPCGCDTNGNGVIDGPPVIGGVGMPAPQESCDFNTLIQLAQNVINFLIFDIAAPLGAVMFAYAGFLYVTNKGNESQVKQAHDVFLYVFIGLVVALVAWLLVNFVLVFFLGANSPYNFLS